MIRRCASIISPDPDKFKKPCPWTPKFALECITEDSWKQEKTTSYLEAIKIRVILLNIKIKEVNYPENHQIAGLKQGCCRNSISTTIYKHFGIPHQVHFDRHTKSPIYLLFWIERSNNEDYHEYYNDIVDKVNLDCSYFTWQKMRQSPVVYQLNINKNVKSSYIL